MEPAQKGGLSLAVEYAKDTAVAKTSASFGDTVVRGMLCNWLVSLGLFTESPQGLYLKGRPRIFFSFANAMSKTPASFDRCGRRAAQSAGCTLYILIKFPMPCMTLYRRPHFFGLDPQS